MIFIPIHKNTLVDHRFECANIDEENEMWLKEGLNDDSVSITQDDKGNFTCIWSNFTGDYEEYNSQSFDNCMDWANQMMKLL